MPLQIVHNDIIKMNTDAVVNAANERLLRGGGVCGAIFKAAGGQALQEACDKIGHCETGQAVITEGFSLQARYIIHAVGPIWRGGNYGEEKLLYSAYQNSLKLAESYELKSIAFPLISAGIYGYPKEAALKVAASAIGDFLKESEMDVYLVVFDRTAVQISEGLFQNVTHYLNTYFREDRSRRRLAEEQSWASGNFSPNESSFYDQRSEAEGSESIFIKEKKATGKSGLQETSIWKKAAGKKTVGKTAEEKTVGEKAFLGKKQAKLDFLFSHMEKTFQETLFDFIDTKNLTDTQVYKRANMDRRLFSKIRSNKEYSPKKTTVFSLAIALELSVTETEKLLASAGYAFNMSSKADVIIRYFLENEEYDIFTINETLFCFEQNVLN